VNNTNYQGLEEAMKNDLRAALGDGPLRTVGIVGICVCLYLCTACEAWRHNLDSSASYFVEVRVSGVVIDASLDAASSVAVVLSIDDQEPTVMAIFCVNEDGERQVWSTGQETLEPLGEDLSFISAANLDECDGQSVALAEVWAEDRMGCPTVVDGELLVAARRELLFAKERVVPASEQDCRSPVVATGYAIIQPRSPPDFVVVDVAAEDEADL
jgi:hypothetical protein